MALDFLNPSDHVRDVKTPQKITDFYLLKILLKCGTRPRASCRQFGHYVYLFRSDDLVKVVSFLVIRVSRCVGRP